jgi:hypothetical protein
MKCLPPQGVCEKPDWVKFIKKNPVPDLGFKEFFWVFFGKEVKLLLHFKKKRSLSVFVIFLCVSCFLKLSCSKQVEFSEINAIQVLFKNFMLKKQDIIEVKIEA